MPRVRPEERKRARRPKTRTGCLTCRKRRIKCDEEKPTCRKCTSTGRKCDGYPEVLVDKSNSLMHHPVVHWTGPAPCPQEQRAFEFFRHITAGHLSGSSDRDFWSSILLQAAHDDVGIRHAIVALGTFHEYYVTTGEAEKVKDDFAIRQYTLAIRQHVETLTRARPNHITGYIVASILFICIELLQMHYESALSLLNKSVRLFYDEAIKEAKTSPWDLDTIEFILQCLQVQAIAIFGARAVYHPPTPGVRPKGSIAMPKYFGSVDEACAWFQHYHISWALADRSLGGENWRVYMEMFHDWKVAYDALMALPDSCTTKRDRQTANLLLIHRMMLDNSISITSAPDFYTTDHYSQEQTCILTAIEQFLVDSHDFNAMSSELSHHFTLEVGVVGPLYDIGLDCRDPAIRRRAIALLRQYPRREGLWDGGLAVRQVEHIVALEESAALDVKSTTGIPHLARISNTSYQFDAESERRVVVDFKREHQVPGFGTSASSIRQVIQW